METLKIELSDKTELITSINLEQQSQPNTNYDIKLIEVEIIEFVKTTILGFENGLYNHIGKMSNDDNFKFVLVKFTVEHYNNIYKSIISNNEPNLYSNEQINKIHKLSGHNYLCLIDILYNLTQKIILSLDRIKFDNSTNDNYLCSIKKQLDNIEYYKLDELNKILLHQCDNIDISNCDPNINIFE